MPNKHVFIIAGESSGDQHAAKFIRELSEKNSHIKFTGIGGCHMQQQGADILFDLTQYSVTGATEAIKHLYVFYKLFHLTKNYLINHKPDLVILVDYPGFNLKVAKLAKSLGLTVLFYISPQVWAWKKGRIKKIEQTVDAMAVILPFEKDVYKGTQVDVRFVGHPLLDTITPKLSLTQAQLEFGLDKQKKTIALLPGSRINEIKRLLPILCETAEKLTQHYPNQCQFLLPIASSLNISFIEDEIKGYSASIKLLSGISAKEVINCSDCVLVASGTASLESALLAKPMAIIYKTTRLTYAIATQVIKVRYLGLCNLLLNKMVVPELIQDDCTSKNLYQLSERLLFDDQFKNTMITQLQTLKKNLSGSNIDCQLSELIIELLNQAPNNKDEQLTLISANV